MRIVFMGTPELAADVLRALSEEFEVCGAFCQPDKPVGRKQVLTAPPVKLLAEELGIPILDADGFRLLLEGGPSAVEHLRAEAE